MADFATTIDFSLSKDCSIRTKSLTGNTCGMTAFTASLRIAFHL
jgi:hypothetical protein